AGEVAFVDAAAGRRVDVGDVVRVGGVVDVDVGEEQRARRRLDPDRVVGVRRVAGEVVLVDAAGAGAGELARVGDRLGGEIELLGDGIDRDAGDQAERDGEIVGEVRVGRREGQLGWRDDGGRGEVGIDVDRVRADRDDRNAAHRGAE